MNWKLKSKIVHNITNLGKRESQVLVLSKNDFSVEEIKEKIQGFEGKSPETQTIRSIRSKLNRHHIKSTFLTNIFNSSFDSIQNPSLSENDFRDSLTIHGYCGQIGSGKTVLTKQHALELNEKPFVDTIQVIDVLDSYGIDCVDTYSDFDINDNVSELIVEKISSLINSYTKNSNVVLFIDQAHYILSNPDHIHKVITQLDQCAANISLRLVTQEIKDFKPILDRIHIFNLLRVSNPKDSILRYNLPVSPTSLHVGTAENPWNEIIRINTQQDNSELQMSYLTEEQQNKILS